MNVFQENNGLNQDTGIQEIYRATYPSYKSEKEMSGMADFLELQRLASPYWKRNTEESRFATLNVAKMKLSAIEFFINKF